MNGHFCRMMTAVAATLVLALGILPSPAEAISPNKAELRGNELRIEGSDAVPNSTITADGIDIGSADGSGNFDIRFSPFSSATCVAQVSDGSITESVELDRCTPSGPSANQSPNANAGADQAVVDADGSGGESVTLDGTASNDPDGSIANYSWAEGVNAVASGSNTTADLAVGSHTITLTITDNDGAMATDIVVVTVDPPAAGNLSPIADAGVDRTFVDSDGNNTQTIVLDARGSSDPDGTIVLYEWTDEAGNFVSNNTTPIMGRAPGVYTFTLTVTDDQGATDTDIVVMTVEPQPGSNGLPIADAGSDQTVTDTDGNGSEMVTLDGSASSDIDGTIVAYEWTENGVPLTAASRQGNPEQQQGIVANAVVAGTFDHLIESNHPDNPGLRPNGFGGRVDSAGDVNGDGFGDLIIASERWNQNDFVEGAALVFLGGPDGPTGTTPAGANAVIETNQDGAFVAGVSSAGDVNADGFDDVMIGSQFYDSVLPGTQLGVSGAVFVFHGGPNGITATGPADADATIFSNQLDSLIGTWLDGAGDLNGDGFDDIVISAPNAGTLFPPTVPINDRSGDYGTVLVYYGGPNGITGTGFNDADAKIVSYEDTGEPLPTVDASVGEAAGAGDINGDGFDDLVVGGSEITVYLGGPSGIVAQDVFDADDRIFGVGPTGFLVDGAGDLNADGFADVVASIPSRQLVPGAVETGEGEIYVLLGGPSGLGVTSITEAHTAIPGESPSSALGFTISGPGDIDADGFDDLLISALSYAGSLDGEGVAYIFRGSAQGITAKTVAEADTRLEAVQSGATRHENLHRLSAEGAGDINGDGFDDVIVGKGYYDNGDLDEGAAFIYNGDSYPANPNIPPVPIAGGDQEVYDRDADGTITVSVDGAASFDPDGTIVSYQWYMAPINGGTGEVLKATGPTATFDLPLISPLPATGHSITLVVTDDQGLRRGDILKVFPRLAPTTFEFAEFADLDSWATTGDVTLGDTGVSFPAPPHVRMQAASTLDRTFSPAAGTTGLDITFWAQGSSFGPGDRVDVQASIDGGTFVDSFSFNPADADGGFAFYGGSAIPISMSWWPTAASTVTLRYQSSLSVGADFWLGALTVRSIQVPIGGVTNQQPSADAGPDVTVVDSNGMGSATVTLDGSASIDPDGSIASYEWRNGSTTIGTGAVISHDLPLGTHTLTLLVIDDQGASDVDNVVVTIQGTPQPGGPTQDVDLAVGTHNITLTVTDDLGAIASDIVQVVVEPTAANQAPTANAGSDQTVTDTNNAGQELVTLDGSASTDAEGAITAYVWRENGAQIAAGVAPQVPLGVGTHTITLTVTDGAGATDVDTVIITVEPFDPSTNAPPVANAGPDQTIVDQDGNTLEVATFDGSGSSDPDGNIVSFNWTLNGNPFGNAETFSVTRPLGTFEVTLIVTDDLGATASDVVIVTVEAAPAPGNELPIAVAGPDQSLSDPDGDRLASTSFDGTGSSDPDGSIASYEWRINGTLAGTGAIQGLVFPVGTNTLELTVRDNNDATSTDTAIVLVAANQSPTAAAGPDQTITDADASGSESVTVQASSSSDPDGTLQFWSWSDGTNVLATTETAVLDLSVGSHTITLTITDDGNATATDTVDITVGDVSTPDGGHQVYLSSSSGGSVDGVSFADEDILLFDSVIQTWSLFVDGSDIGLGGAGARDIDAFALLGDGSVLLSIVSGSTLPDVGAIDDSDIVRFIPSSTGTNTAGTFDLYFDGSDVGLTTNGEDVDAVSVLPGGDLVISTSGNPRIAGLSGLSDEDLIRFSPTSLGATTAGSFGVWFDGSDVALDSASSEDLHGASVDVTGDLHLTTRGAFSVLGASGAGADVFTCVRPSTGTATSCDSFSVLSNGAAQGIGSEVVDGIHVVRQ